MIRKQLSAPGKRNAEDTKVTDALIVIIKFTSDKDVINTTVDMGVIVPLQKNWNSQFYLFNVEDIII